MKLRLIGLRLKHGFCGPYHKQRVRKRMVLLYGPPSQITPSMIVLPTQDGRYKVVSVAVTVEDNNFSYEISGSKE